MSVNTQKLLASLREVSGNEFASLSSEGTLGDSGNFISTGSYLLDMQISGDMFKGLAGASILTLGGESSTGKTFFSISLINSFLKDHENGIVLIFDSENAINKERLETRGCDLERINYYPVTSLFQFHTEANKILDELNSNYNRGDVEVLIVVDSLGNLPSSKEIADTKKGEQKVDLTRTKEVRSIFRQLTVKLAKLSMRMIVTNHTYANIMSVGQQVMAGGGGIKYASDTILTLTKSKDKGSDGTVLGNVITTTAVKARDSKENTKAKHLLSYTHGLHKYYGLIDYAVMDNNGIPWSKKGTKIQIGTDKDSQTYFAKHIYKNASKFFTEDILQKLNTFMKQFYTYGTIEDEEEIFSEEIKKEETIKKAKKAKRKR
jgi:RecA/RadA recombinase